MFSAVKLVAASAIVALLGGLLLTGILTTPESDEIVPATETVSSAPMAGDPRVVSGREVIDPMLEETRARLAEAG